MIDKIKYSSFMGWSTVVNLTPYLLLWDRNRTIERQPAYIRDMVYAYRDPFTNRFIKHVGYDNTIPLYERHVFKCPKLTPDVIDLLRSISRIADYIFITEFQYEIISKSMRIPNLLIPSGEFLPSDDWDMILDKLTRIID